MKYFNSNEDLKKQYRTWCKKLHPDHGGDPEAFREMMEEYEELQLHGFKKRSTSTRNRINRRTWKSFKENSNTWRTWNWPCRFMVVGIWWNIQFQGCVEAGFKWASKRKKWYFSEEKAKGKFKGDFEQLKAHHGFKEIKGKTVEKIA